MRSLVRVCKRWKSVILSTPSLWAVINGTAPLRDMEIAARKSQSVPLTITYQYAPSVPWAEFSQVLRASQSPWWAIDIEAPGGFFILEQPVFERPNPALSHIRLHSTSSFSQPIPWLTLSDGCPIRSLDLRFASVSWDSPRLTGLVQLRLVYTDAMPEARLATILMESPLLEELFINGVSLITSPESCPRVGIPMKDLRFMYLGFTQTSFNRILTLIRPPSTANIMLENVEVGDLAKGDDPVLFHAVPPTLPPYPCIRVRFTSDRFSAVVKPTSKNKTRYDIYGRHGGMHLFYPTLIGRWATFVTKLEMNLPIGFRDVPIDGLEKLCNLEILKISGDSWVTGVLSFLSRPTEPLRDGGDWPCGKLISITVTFRTAGSYSRTGTSFLQAHASAISDLVQKRWNHVARAVNDTSKPAALSSLIVQVPEELTDADAVDALATMACQSAKILGHGVLRILSIE